MHEPSEDPVPSDPNAINPPPAKTKIGVLLVIVLMIFAMILPAACLIPLSFTSNAPAIPRLLLLTLAVFLLFLLAFLGRIAQVVMRRRRKSGRWSLWPTDAERAHFARLREQRTPQQIRRESAVYWLVDIGMLAFLLVNIWMKLRPKHEHDDMDRLFGGYWILFLAYYVYTIYRQRRKRPTATG